MFIAVRRAVWLEWPSALADADRPSGVERSAQARSCCPSSRRRPFDKNRDSHVQISAFDQHPCRCASHVQYRFRPRSEEHTSELQSLMRISYAVFCLTKKTEHHATLPIHSDRH